MRIPGDITEAHPELIDMHGLSASPSICCGEDFRQAISSSRPNDLLLLYCYHGKEAPLAIMDSL